MNLDGVSDKTHTQMVVAGTSDTQRQGGGWGLGGGVERARKLYFTRIGGRKEGERERGRRGETNRQRQTDIQTD